MTKVPFGPDRPVAFPHTNDESTRMHPEWLPPTVDLPTSHRVRQKIGRARQATRTTGRFIRTMGRMIWKTGRAIQKTGRLIQKTSRLIQKTGRLIQKTGRLIRKMGEFIQAIGPAQTTQMTQETTRSPAQTPTCVPIWRKTRWPPLTRRHPPPSCPNAAPDLPRLRVGNTRDHAMHRCPPAPHMRAMNS